MAKTNESTSVSDTKSNNEFKINLMGDPSVGKSSLLLREADKTYTERYASTIGVGSRLIKRKVGNSECDLTVYDTQPGGLFIRIPPNFEPRYHAAIICFDLTEQFSLSSVKNQIASCRQSNPGIPIIIVGTKSDLSSQRVIERETAVEFANAYDGIEYVETSSKTDTNVSEVFDVVANKLLPKASANLRQDETIPILHKDTFEKIITLLNAKITALPETGSLFFRKASHKRQALIDFRNELKIAHDKDNGLDLNSFVSTFKAGKVKLRADGPETTYGGIFDTPRIRFFSTATNNTKTNTSDLLDNIATMKL